MKVKNMSTRKSEFERMVETKIADLEKNIKKLDQMATSQRAEIVAYRNAIEWNKFVNSKKKKVENK